MHTLLSSLLRRLSSARAAILLITAGIVIAHLAGVPLLDALESKSYDMRLLAAASQKVPEQVAIVAIDEKSLSAAGRWPWSRSKIAELAERISQAGAAVIAFDILFSEPENAQLIAQMDRLKRNNGAGQGDAYRNLRASLNTDAALASILGKTNTSVLPVVFMWSAEETRHIRAGEALQALEALLPNAIKSVHTNDNAEPLLNSPDPQGLTVNVPQLQAAAHASGHINISPDADGSLRRVALAVRYQGRFFPSADLQAARMLLGMPELALNTASYGITGLELGQRSIPTDAEGNILISYYGPAQTVPTLSAIDVLEGRANPRLLKGRVVLLGTTAKGIGDIRVTPYSPVFPGVEVRATIVQNLLDGSFRYRPEWLQLAEPGALILCGLLLAFALPRLNLRQAAVLCATLFALMLLIVFAAFQRHLWVNLVYPSLLILLAFAANTLMQRPRGKADKH